MFHLDWEMISREVIKEHFLNPRNLLQQEIQEFLQVKPSVDKMGVIWVIREPVEKISSKKDLRTINISTIVVDHCDDVTDLLFY